jgi:hypothetical protein
MLKFKVFNRKKFGASNKTQLAVAVKLIVVVIGVFTAGPPAPGAAVETTKSRLCATSML